MQQNGIELKKNGVEWNGMRILILLLGLSKNGGISIILVCCKEKILMELNVMKIS